MAELDKFKRRLIRSVGRLLLKENKEPAEVWATLHKETGRDCQEIWKRMRTLTLKKLSRLLAADDYADKVGKIARMSLTDWLMFDMVLVHEKVDVISVDKGVKASKLTSLSDLFELVDYFKIETMRDDPHARAEAWAALVLKYNETGRECSPMLLQLRWHQMKETTRVKFYGFWNAFRGNKRNLPGAKIYEPTPLQMAIAKKFTRIVTEPFKSWEDQIKENKVILLDHFIVLKQNKKSAIKEVFEQGCFLPPDNYVADSSDAVANDNEPDVVVLEPKIETITLGDDSDEEDNREKPSTPENPERNTSPITEPSIESINEIKSSLETAETNIQIGQGVEIKKELVQSIEIPEEPEVDGLLNVEIIAATHVPTEEIDEPSDDHEIDLATKQLEMLNSENTAVIDDLCIKSEIDNFIEDNAVNNEEASDISRQVRELEGVNDANSCLEAPNVAVGNEEAINISRQDKELDDIDDSNPSLEAPNVTDTNNSVVKDLEDMEDPIIRIAVEASHDVKTEMNETEPKECTDSVSSNVLNTIGDVPSNLEFLDDGIDMDEEYEDDVFEDKSQNQIDSLRAQTSSPDRSTAAEMSSDDEKSTDSDNSQDEAQSPKFDLKLMMLPVVYTTKLDNMKMFKNADLQYLKTAGLIDSILAESKPFSTQSVNITPEIREEPEEKKVIYLTSKEKTVSDDLITLAPATNTDRLVNINFGTELQEEKDFHSTTQNKDIDEDLIKLAPEDEEEYESSGDDICDDQKVKQTSYLFQKPRNRNYTPIQLCKNPDFNTRLKKLSIGFFTSERNRQLLTACKPLTIDLHKTFESKLLNNTIYFKSTKTLEIPQPIKEEQPAEQQLVTVAPSAMPAQSLINQTNKVDIEDLLPANANQEDEVLIAERNKNKVINLPDIVKVRRLNQRLATAEVSPIQVKNTGVIEISPMVLSHNVGSENCDDAPGDLERTLQELKKECISEITEAIESKAPEQDTENSDVYGRSELDCLNTDLSETGDDSLDRESDSARMLDRKMRAMKFREYMKMREKPPPVVTCLNPESAKELLDPKANKSAKLSFRCKNMPQTPWYSTSFASSLNTQREMAINYSIIGDSLLTLDTLNKMISLLHGSKIEEVYGNSKKKKVKKAPPPQKQKLLNTEVINLDEKEKHLEEKEAEQHEAVKSIETPPPLLALSETPVVTKVKPKVRLVRKNRNSNPKKLKPLTVPADGCCWARLKIRTLELLNITNMSEARMHRCTVAKRLCTCCCIKDLLEFKLTPPSKRADCCWAREKLTNLKVNENTEGFLKPHRCALENRQCDCCCIKDLVVYETDHLPLIAGINKAIPKSSPLKKQLYTVNEIDRALVEVLNDESPELQTDVPNVSCVTVVANTEFSFVPKTTNVTDLPLDSENNATNNLNHSIVNNKTETSKDSLATVSTDLNKSTDSEQFILLSDDDIDNDDGMTATDAESNRDVASVEGPINDQEIICAPVNEIIDDIIKHNENVLAPMAGTHQSQKKSSKPHESSTVSLLKPTLAKNYIVPQKQSTVKRKVWKTKYVIRCAKSESKCPINMGEGKILLTNAKIPLDLLDPEIAAQIPKPDCENPVLPGPPVQLPSLEIPGFPIPNGVSLVLAPNGDISCIMEPGVQIDASLQLQLKAIVENLQLQMRNSTDTQLPTLPGLIGQNDVSTDAQNAANTDKFGDVISDSVEKGSSETRVEQTETSLLVHSIENLACNDDKLISTNSLEVSTATVPEQAEHNSPVKVNSNNKAKFNPEVASSETQISQCSRSNHLDGERDINSDVDAVESVSSKKSDLAQGEQEHVIKTVDGLSDKTCETESVETTSEKIQENHTQEIDDTGLNNIITENQRPDEPKSPSNEREKGEVNNREKEYSDKNTETANNSCHAKKSILSDLMEMSGISSEDMLSAPEPFLVPAASPEPIVVPEVMCHTQELTQITTLAALKYAHNQNARFFKYDVATATMVLIKVSIEKVQKNPCPPITKAIIDLTDEVVPTTVVKRGRGRPRLATKNDAVKSTLENAKTIIPQRKKRAPTRFENKEANKNRSLLRQDSKPSTSRKRQPSLDVETVIQGSYIPRKKPRKPRIEARIYLDDSDEPMEEEYLVDSSSDSETEKDFKTSQQKYRHSLLDQERPQKSKESEDESSDDEPLAKKVLRKKEANDSVLNVAVEKRDTEKPIHDTLVPIGEPEPTEVANITATPVLFDDNTSQEGSDDFILGA